MAELPIRIGNFSGYLGDRWSAIADVLAGDPVDVLAGDYLAEITLAPLAGRFQDDPSRGYVERFVDQIRPHLAEITRRGIRVVTNAGGFNPAGLARALREIAAAEGFALNVAYVEGDNLLNRLDDIQSAGHRLEHLDTDASLRDWEQKPIAANAYLGGWGIASALRDSADIVVCGRVTDASLIVGPAAWWHDWEYDSWDALAGAVVAGHVIECGPQAVGGNFSGFRSVPGIEQPGFPIAEVAADGSCVITKHGRDGGTVTVDTVTAQLVYEIQGPLYLNPDVTVHVDSVVLRPAGHDRVTITGVRGSPPPPTAKIAIFAVFGFQTVQTVYVTAPDVEAKVELLGKQVAAMVDDDVQVQLTRIGCLPNDPATQWEATVPVRIMALASERHQLAAERFADGIYGLYLSSYPGFYHDGGAKRVVEPHVRIEYWPALLPVELVDHRVYLDDGRTVDIPAPAHTELLRQPHDPEPETPTPTGTEIKRALGDVAFARSGDKGGNCNVGIWVSNPEAWPWLRQTLSSNGFRRLVPEYADLDIVRHELPSLHAVHFVIRGLLGRGGSSNTRVDQVGKAVGEYIRSRHLDIPAELVTEASRGE
jgi:hypothetical protein